MRALPKFYDSSKTSSLTLETSRTSGLKQGRMNRKWKLWKYKALEGISSLNDMHNTKKCNILQYSLRATEDRTRATVRPCHSSVVKYFWYWTTISPCNILNTLSLCLIGFLSFLPMIAIADLLRCTFTIGSVLSVQPRPRWLLEVNNVYPAFSVKILRVFPHSNSRRLWCMACKQSKILQTLQISHTTEQR